VRGFVLNPTEGWDLCGSCPHEAFIDAGHRADEEGGSSSVAHGTATAESDLSNTGTAYQRAREQEILPVSFYRIAFNSPAFTL
jgi:hypothetical protein